MPVRGTKEPTTEQRMEDVQQKGHDLTQSAIKFLSKYQKEIGLIALGAGASLVLRRKIDDYIRPSGTAGELYIDRSVNGNVKFIYTAYDRFKRPYFLCSWSVEPHDAIDVAKKIYDEALVSIKKEQQ